MMKKITFIVFLLISVMGFSQTELVTNGDFQANSGGPALNWYGNANNAVDLGGNNIVNQAQVMAAGTPFSVNLSQEILLDNGKTYELNFDAFTDATTASRPITVGLGQTGAPFAALTEVPTITDTPQTFTFTFTIDYGDAVTDRVIFDIGAATGFVFIDNVSVIEVATPPSSVPTVAAPTPPVRDPSDVVNVYSAAYANSQTLTPNVFGQAANTSTAMEGTVAGTSDTYWGIKHSGQDFMGFDFSSNVDASLMTRFHMDYWTEGQPVGAVINVKFSQHDGGFATGETDAAIHLINPPGADGQWNSIDIPITDFNVGIFGQGLTVRNFLSQLVISASGASAALFDNIYFDNMYFHTATTASADDFAKTSFKTYPNPTQDNWTIETQNVRISSITVYDVLGKSVMSMEPNEERAVIDGSGLKSGLYFAKVETTEGVSSLKLIKK